MQSNLLTKKGDKNNYGHCGQGNQLKAAAKTAMAMG